MALAVVLPEPREEKSRATVGQGLEEKAACGEYQNADDCFVVPEGAGIDEDKASERVFVLKGRPSGISRIITVDLPRPRTHDTLRLARFAELREQVWNTLVDEVRAAEFHVT